MKKSKKQLAFWGSFLFSVAYTLFIAAGQTGSPSAREMMLNGTVVFLNVWIIGCFGYRIFKHHGQKTPAQLKKTILPLFAFFVIGAFVLSFLIMSLGHFVFYWTERSGPAGFADYWFRTGFSHTFTHFSLWIPVVSVFLFYRLWRQAVDREQDLYVENLHYRYRTLKTQVNPHFLFNSLNTFSEIVYTDAAKADAYIQKLAAIYRYLLDHEKTDWVPLSEELEFVNRYFVLQKERDGNKIRLEIEVENADKYKIVPVSIQILVENALKHNARSAGKPLEIHIQQTAGFIEVSNGIQRKNMFDSSSGTGLANLRKRVALVTGKEVVVSRENNRFVVKLPLVDK